MAMVVTYMSFNGMIVHENRAGVGRDYLPDTLGSTAALVDDSQDVTDSWDYWPYGEISQSTGTHPAPFTFLGLLGYFRDVFDKEYYVRARYLKSSLARWFSADPLWPAEAAYTYVRDSPVRFSDPSGLRCGRCNCNKECAPFKAEHCKKILPSPPYPPNSKSYAFALCCDTEVCVCYCGEEEKNPIVRECRRLHEESHAPIVTCIPGYIGFPDTGASECAAAKITIKCIYEACKTTLTNDCIGADVKRCFDCKRLKYACLDGGGTDFLRQYCWGCGVN